MLPKNFSLYTVIILLILIYACSGNNENIPGQYRDLENLTVFPADPNPEFKLDLIREHTYGSTDEHLIGSMGSTEIDDRGRVFIADSKQSTVHIFNPDGTYLTHIGRSGNGPGEISGPLINISIIRNRLLVRGFWGIASVFSLDSLKYVESVKIHPENMADIDSLDGLNPSQYIPRNDGNFLVKFMAPRNVAEAADGPGMNPYYLMNREGQLQNHKFFELRDITFLTAKVDGQLRPATFPFTPASLIALSNENHVYTMFTSDFLIKEYSPEGAYMRAIYYPYDNIPVSRDALLEEYTLKVHQKIIKNNALPEYWPATRSMIIDGQDRIWVATIVDEDDVYEWWVLDNDGSLLARYDWPKNSYTLQIKNGNLYTREKDEKEISHIIQYKIQFKDI